MGLNQHPFPRISANPTNDSLADHLSIKASEQEGWTHAPVEMAPIVTDGSYRCSRYQIQVHLSLAGRTQCWSSCRIRMKRDQPRAARTLDYPRHQTLSEMLDHRKHDKVCL